MEKEPVRLSENVKGCKENVFVCIGELMSKYNPVDLCAGKANFKEVVPDRLRDALVATQNSDVSYAMDQYARSKGHPDLVRELADIYSKILCRDINAMDEILTTIGADESLFCITKAILNPGDEVIIIEPFYVSFETFVKSCGAVPRFVTLQRKAGTKTANDLVLNEDELRQAFNEKTRAIVVNSPHNPTGKIFNFKEMTLIADLCKQYNCLYISDEVYEWLRYDEERVSITSIPGMWERSVTIGSAGKAFNVTGWKVGWSIGPEYLISAAYKIHVDTVYCVATPLQAALAEVLRHEKNLIGTEESYWYQLSKMAKVKRDNLYRMLSDAGLDPLLPNGGYFMMIDISKFKFDSDSKIKEHDRQVSNWLITEKGLAALPVSAFYSDGNKYDKYLRFCFMRSDDTLEAAEEKIKHLRD